MTGGERSPLAILGGEPRFASPLHVGCPNLGDQAAFLQRIEEVWSSQRLTNDGPLVREFERRVAEIAGVPHAVAVCNATAGLEVAMRGLELTGEVIVPAFTFVATVHAVSWMGLTPVFCDVDPETHNLDPAAVRRAITPRTSAILAVNLWGNGAAPLELERIAAEHRLRLLFDSAHAFGCSHDHQPIGSFGDLEVFSFHATKFVHSGEGGAIVTRDDELARRLRLLRNFGFATYDSVTAAGVNAKLSELHAAMGLTSLDSMPRFVEANRRNYAAYDAAFSHLPGIRLHPRPSSEVHNHQYVVLEVAPDETPLTRDELHRTLQAEGVLARRYFYPGCHRIPATLAAAADVPPLPVTDRLCETVLQLPTGINVSIADIRSVGELVVQAFSKAKEIREALRALEAGGGDGAAARS
ncbi:MAG: aminotransferase class I/II-fold pyridoxal phosphate-dependent enzyme [Planctomycetaceae bacterium]